MYTAERPVETRWRHFSAAGVKEYLCVCKRTTHIVFHCRQQLLRSACISLLHFLLCGEKMENYRQITSAVNSSWKLRRETCQNPLEPRANKFTPIKRGYRNFDKAQRGIVGAGKYIRCSVDLIRMQTSPVDRIRCYQSLQIASVQPTNA